MSSALAIASVTAVLKDLLLNAAIDADWTDALGDVRVSALPPDRITAPNNGEPSQLNIFMVQATPNVAWRNVDLPSRDSRGRPVSNPPLALDLHYLLTAYSAEELHGEILLGYAMQLLHETPILKREDIRKSLDPGQAAATGLPAAMRQLSTSGLADQLELVKLVPEPLSTEEISKLWAAFQTSYRPTAAYQASVVLIERRRPVRAPLPVRERKLFVIPFRRPVIDSVAPQVVAVGGTLVLEGKNLDVAGAVVRVDQDEVVPSATAVGRVEVVPPAATPAGMHAVQVVQPIDLGTANEPHGGFRSNVVAFVLAPSIASALPAQVAQGSPLAIDVAPPVGRTQEVALLLGEETIALPLRSDDQPASTLEFPIPANFPTGSHLVRVQVDGAQSALETDAQGAYTGPQVEVVA